MLSFIGCLFCSSEDEVCYRFGRDEEFSFVCGYGVEFNSWDVLDCVPGRLSWLRVEVFRVERF